MGKAMDPSVRILIERLVGVTEDGAEELREGNEGSPFVGHLEFGRVPIAFGDTGIGFEIKPLIEVFISRNGTELLARTAALRREIDDEDTDRIVLLVEIEPGAFGPGGPDEFSGLVWELAFNPRLDPLDLRIALDSLGLGTRVLELFGRSDVFIEAKIDQAQGRAKQGVLSGVAFRAAAAVMHKLADAAQGIAGFLEARSKMPEEMWNPRKSPEEMRAALADLERTINARVKDVSDEIDGLKVTRQALVSETLAQVIPDVLLEYIDRVIGSWNGALTMLKQVADGVRGIGSSIKEGIETLLGYISGVWDGIMDAVIGLFQIVALGARVFALFLTAKRPLERAEELLLEAADEVLQAFSRIDWGQVWTWLKGAAPKIVRLVIAQAESFLDKATRSSSVAGYYFGYLVYVVVETFFPPLKATSIARSGRRVAAASFFGKLFP